jgi:PadR family transcriptional regulator
MTKGDNLGDLEQMVLLALMRLGNDAYGVTIRREIEARTGRPVTLGSIYPTLHRLESKGYVRSFTGEPTATRGGRARRHFILKPDGRTALHRQRRMLNAMWEGFDADTEPRSS